MGSNFQTIALLADELAKHIEPLGLVMLNDIAFEDQMRAELSMIDGRSRQLDYLQQLRNEQEATLVKNNYFGPIRVRTVAQWCQGYIRGWLYEQGMTLYTDIWPLDKPLWIRLPSGEVIEGIFANKQYRQSFDSYAKTVQVLERYNWLTDQIKQLSNSQQSDSAERQPSNARPDVAEPSEKDDSLEFDEQPVVIQKLAFRINKEIPKSDLPSAVQEQLKKGSKNKVVMYDAVTNEAVNYDLPDDTLDRFLGLYMEAVDTLPNKVKAKFPDVLDEIWPLLERRYEINPQPSGFAQWFLENKVGAHFSGLIEFIKGQSHVRSLTVIADMDVLEQLLDPAVIVKDLGQYCQWRREMTIANLEQVDIHPATAADHQSSAAEQRTLFITELAQQALFDVLATFVDKSQYTALSNLLAGLAQSDPVILNCKQNRLGAIFHPFVKTREINAGADKCSQWICQYFRRNDNGNIVGLSQSTLEKHLKGQSLPKD